MFRNSATNLLNISKETARNWLKTIDTVLTDCDGVLWHDNVAIAGAAATINALKSNGKRVYFITNNSTHTRLEIWQRARMMGFDIAETDIIAPAYSIAKYLQARNFKQTVYVIGGPAVIKELDDVGIAHFGVGPDLIEKSLVDYVQRQIATLPTQDVGAVLVGFDEHFSYGKMMKACNYLVSNENCLFLVTNVDPVHRLPEYHLPGTGALLKAIETCVQREALQFGKPNPVVVETLINEGLLVPERTLMVGDCCRIDIPFGKNCGFQTMFVETGSYELQQVFEMMKNPTENELYIPDVYLPALGDLEQFI